MVDFPAPGGACRMTILFVARRAFTSGITSNMGRLDKIYPFDSFP